MYHVRHLSHWMRPDTASISPLFHGATDSCQPFDSRVRGEREHVTPPPLTLPSIYKIQRSLNTGKSLVAGQPKMKTAHYIGNQQTRLFPAFV